MSPDGKARHRIAPVLLRRSATAPERCLVSIAEPLPMKNSNTPWRTIFFFVPRIDRRRNLCIPTDTGHRLARETRHGPQLVQNHIFATRSACPSLPATSAADTAAFLRRPFAAVYSYVTCGKLIRRPLTDRDSTGSTTCDRISRALRTGAERSERSQVFVFSGDVAQLVRAADS